MLDVCYYYQVLEEFGLFCVEIKAILGLNCVPEHAQMVSDTALGSECIWEWSVHEIQSEVAIFNFRVRRDFGWRDFAASGQMSDVDKALILYFLTVIFVV